MKWWWISVVWAVLLPQVSWAETDCVVPNRLERVIDALDRVIGNPLRIVSEDNLAVIAGEMRHLTLPQVTSAIFKDLSPMERDTVLAVLATARKVTARKSTDRNQPISTAGWKTTLNDAKAILADLPCLESTAQSRGDGEGRNAAASESGAAANDAPFRFKVENLPEKAAAGAASSAVLAGALFFLVPWIKRRRQLLKRRARRFDVSLDATMDHQGTSHQVEIVNLSCNGAKVRYWSKTPIEERQTIALEIDETPRQATVMWSNNLFLGVRFDQVLRIKLVRSLAGVSRFDALGRRIAKK